MLSKNKDDQYIDNDQRDNPLMTLRTVQFYCQKQSLHSVPQMNDKLYLQYKSFTKIIPQTISKYLNITSLYLNNNAISKIEGLNMLRQLKYIYLQHNFIQKIQGLEQQHKLLVLNLSHNKIQRVENLEPLQSLQTLNLSKNFITHAKDIQNLIALPKLSTLDLSMNQIECSQSVFQILIELQKLTCLYLKYTPMAKIFKNYRKRFISYLRHLKFLDDRPVLQQDHRIAQAWLNGGVEKQKLEKDKINQQKNKSFIQKSNQIESEDLKTGKTQLQDNHTVQQRPQSKKIDNYGFPQFDAQFQMHLKNSYASPLLNCKYQYTGSQIQKLSQKSVEIKQLEQEDIYKKVEQVLGKKKMDFQQQQQKTFKRIIKKWNPNYQAILQALLMKYKFDFSQVQPSFNMILSNIAKKITKPAIRYQIQQLRLIWTLVQKRKRKQGVKQQIINHIEDI